MDAKLSSKTQAYGMQVRLIRLPASAAAMAVLYSVVRYHYYIIFLLEGEIELLYDEKAILARASHILLLPADCYMRTGKAQIAKFWILGFTQEYASGSLYRKSFPLAHHISKLQALDADTDNGRIIRELLLLLDKHQGLGPSENSSQICQLTMNLLLSCIDEMAAAPAAVVHRGMARKESVANEFLKLAGVRAKEHHDVRHYAGLLCMTQGNLTRIIKEVTAKPPKALLEGILIQVAIELLDKSIIPIYLVAEELNFRSSSAFIHFFRRHTGYTPNEYRNRKTR